MDRGQIHPVHTCSLPPGYLLLGAEREPTLHTGSRSRSAVQRAFSPSLLATGQRTLGVMDCADRSNNVLFSSGPWPAGLLGLHPLLCAEELVVAHELIRMTVPTYPNESGMQHRTTGRYLSIACSVSVQQPSSSPCHYLNTLSRP